MANFSKKALPLLRTAAANLINPSALTSRNQSNVADKRAITNHFMRLAQPKNKVQVSYVWIDGSGKTMREKTMTVAKEPQSHEDLPWWAYDGSSTYQAQGDNSDMKLKPVRLFKDPFRGGPNKLLLCEAIKGDGTPDKSNKRSSCAEAMEKIKDKNPWFGLEQEYTMMDVDGHPHGWPKPAGFPKGQGPYYCGVGAGKIFGREIAEAHYRACLYCDLDIGGINFEVMPGQSEYQIGPTTGVDAADQLWISRYILERVAEEHNVVISFDPKPVEGDWNGAGCHCNFSTEAMRKPGGKEEIWKVIERLGKRHDAHIAAYDPSGGLDNAKRLTGKHETQSIHKFTAGVADRTASIRLPRSVDEKGFGFLEDRRPSSNCDPYAVTDIIVRTSYLNE